MEIPSVAYAHGKALCLSIGEEASDSNIAKPKDGPPLPDFDPSMKCEHHFGAEGRTLEECKHLRH